LRRRLEALDATVFSRDLAVADQALHGDASLSNLLWRPSGFVFNDFEDVFRGPRHWDVASLIEALRLRGADRAFTDRALAAYGWAEPAALEPFTAAQRVYGEIWQAYDLQHRVR
jgi:Ser/Thr protein kinase RdoA (MazF antagonist)